jgi:membrane-bound lytic murein transglycosylase C
MLKNLALCVLFASAAHAASFAEYKQQTQRNFTQEKSKFQAYKAAEQKAFHNYVKELQKYWKKPILSSKKVLVTYTKDKKSRTLIDFKHNKLTIETIAKNEKEAKQKLALALAKAVTFDTKDFYANDELQQQLSKIETKSGLVSDKVDTAPVLSPIIFEKQPTKEQLFKYVKKTLHTHPITAKKERQEKIYSLNIQLPNDATVKRSRIYYADVKREAQNQQIPLSLVFAIIQTESSFNPMARSYVPAYGLMQIVPRTAGIDAYYYLYKRKRVVGGSYLYNAKNNIKMGSAYLHILYYNYLKDIKDPRSRLYCTIAAYNTGAGNVARAFAGSNNRYRAAQIINRLNPQEVYTQLLNNLRYEEPKRYLVKVNKRMGMYERVYGGES